MRQLPFTEYERIMFVCLSVYLHGLDVVATNNVDLDGHCGRHLLHTSSLSSLNSHTQHTLHTLSHQ